MKHSLRSAIASAIAALLTLPLLVALISTPASAQTGRLFVSVDCFGVFESVTVSNFSDVDITVLGVSSLVQSDSERTFARSDPLPDGHQLTYTFGPSPEGAAAGGLTQLSDAPIFAHDVAGEGVQVQTSLGTLAALCPAGVGSLAVAQPSAPVVPTLEPAPVPEIPSASDIPGAAGIVGTTGGGFSPVVATAEGSERLEKTSGAPAQVPARSAAPSPPAAAGSTAPSQPAAEIAGPAASGSRPDAAPRPEGLPRTGSVGFEALALLTASVFGAGLGLRRIGR